MAGQSASMRFVVRIAGDIVRRPATLAKCALMRISTRYHAAVVTAYWNSTTTTHGDVSDAAFDEYALRIAQLLGDGAQCSLLDYGGGTGDIGMRLSERGWDVTVAEFTSGFERLIQDKGLRFIPAREIPAERFDVVLANNCMQYVHPRRLDGEVRRLLVSVKPGGQLWITDTPSVEKMSLLGDGRVRAWRYRWTRVYQLELGGFFVDLTGVANETGGRVLDSWSPYRSHLNVSRVPSA